MIKKARGPFSSFRSKPSDTRSAQITQLEMEALEPLNMLAPLAPDMFAWADESRGYLYDYVVEGDLLRFTTALTNDGAGNLELRGGQVLPNGNQEVWQRIYDSDGSFVDHLAGEFVYHPGHGHIHFDGYAEYNLRDVTPEGGVGEIVATGGKVSFCLIDITQYNPDAGGSNYHSCGQIQGVTAGWSDVYSRSLPDQWINIAGIDDGDYWLEVVIDPDNQLIESDETNNVTQIPVTINGGPGDQGDRFEPNNSFVAAQNLGFVAQRHEAAISIHTENDVDYYQFSAVEDGNFEVTVEFTHALGDLNAFIYDSNQNLIVSGESTDDLEQMNWAAVGGETYYLKVEGANNETNGYELDFHGPGDVITETVKSADVPVNIPDSNSSSTPGQTVTSTLQGPDITINDLNMILNDLDHTWVGDLHIDITSPAGTTATILTSQWEDGGGLLGGSDNFTNTFLDDQAPTNLGDGTAPYTGSFNVEHSNIVNSPFAAFNGESALGQWTISITDWFTGDSGTLRSWSLMFTGIDNNPGDDFEQNDDFPQATWLGDLGVAQVSDASIHTPTDQDFFRFKALATGVAHIDMSFTHSFGNLDFEIYDDTLTEIARGDSITDNESVSVPVETDRLYYVRVLGNSGDTNDYGLTIDTPTKVFESEALVDVGTEWQAFTFAREFVNPVVILSMPTMNDGSPVVTEIQNVTGTGFEMRLAEWDYQDGSHANESIAYFVVEAGRHELSDGTILEAGRQADVASDPSTVDFETSFANTPVIITQAEANPGQETLTSRLTRIGSDKFGIRLQGQEGVQSSAQADVHWVAIEETNGLMDGRAFETGMARPVTDAVHQATYNQPFASQPIVFGEVQSQFDSDPVTARLHASATDSLSFNLQEDQAWDKETKHGKETFGYFSIAVPVSGFGRSIAPPPTDSPTNEFATRDLAIADSVNKSLEKQDRFEIAKVEDSNKLPTIELDRAAADEGKALVLAKREMNDKVIRSFKLAQESSETTVETQKPMKDRLLDKVMVDAI